MPPTPTKQPHPRHLTLASPFMEGNDVKRLQRKLGIDADGVYGPITARAVATSKRLLGFPPAQWKTGASIDYLEYLYGERPLAAEFKKRADKAKQDDAKKLGAGAKGASARKRALQFALQHRNVVEQPLGKNRGPVIDRWQRECGHPPFRSAAEEGWPWCGVFIRACYHHGARIDLDNRVADTSWIYYRAKANTSGLKMVPLAQAKGGDLLLTGKIGQHVAMVREDYTGGNVRTVEGNCNHRVTVRERTPREVVGVVRVTA